jgi:hypothetical protein
MYLCEEIRTLNGDCAEKIYVRTLGGSWLKDNKWLNVVFSASKILIDRQQKEINPKYIQICSNKIPTFNVSKCGPIMGLPESEAVGAIGSGRNRWAHIC